MDAKDIIVFRKYYGNKKFVRTSSYQPPLLVTGIEKPVSFNKALKIRLSSL
jgi:hypothetical protein